jgi:glutamyl-tRNA reductase
MIGSYKVITFTHHQIDVASLGKYQITISDQLTLENALSILKNNLKIDELMYLSTCNRVTYIFTSKDVIDDTFLVSFMQEVNPHLTEKDITALENFVNVYEGIEAVQHVFEVACSVDSLVVGESEIFHQFRNAFNDAITNGHIGDNLRLLEKITVQVAKKIYSHTRINEKPLSIASLAGQALLTSQFDNKSKVIMIGAGETNTLVAKFLLKHQFTNIDIYNRSKENAEKLVGLTHGKAYTLKDLDKSIPFDVIVVCTASQQAVLTHEIYKAIIGNDNSHKMIIDLSVPANVASDVINNENVKYISIDNLKELAEKNLSFRKREIVLAKTIIQESLEEFETLYAQRQIELALKDLPAEISMIKNKIINSVFKEKLSSFEPHQLEILHEILDYMSSKAVAVPMKLAKKIV